MSDSVLIPNELFFFSFLLFSSLFPFFLFVLSFFFFFFFFSILVSRRVELCAEYGSVEQTEFWRCVMDEQEMSLLTRVDTSEMRVVLSQAQLDSLLRDLDRFPRKQRTFVD